MLKVLRKNRHKLDFKYIILCDFYIDSVSGIRMIFSSFRMASSKSCGISGYKKITEKKSHLNKYRRSTKAIVFIWIMLSSVKIKIIS